MALAADQTYTIHDLAQMQIAHSGNWYQQQAMKSILLTEARGLPVAERLKLVEAIWDSIAESHDQLPLTEAQAAELERRLVEYEKNPEAGASWDEVRERILKRS